MINKLYKYIDGIYSKGLGKDVWFMTKQTMTDFYMPLFIAEIVENYNSKKLATEGFGDFYSRCFRENQYTLTKFPKQSESENTYRNAIIAEFFGLFYRKSIGYDSGIVTPAYQILRKYIKDHNDINKYRFLVDRQIEKLCLNVNVKTRIYDDVKGVTIFPVIYLYKILIELYDKYGDSKLDYNEFLLFLVHSKSYSQWDEIIDLIDIYRKNDVNEEYQKKINVILHDGSMTNIRFDTLFGTLENIEYSTLKYGNYYKIKENDKSINYIRTVVEIYEHSDYLNCKDKNKLLLFMQSDKYFIGNLDIFSVIHDDREENMVHNDILKLIIDTYNSHSFDYNSVKQKYDLFKKMYGKDAIASLEGRELLYRLFAPKKLSSEGLTYNIEFSNFYRDFGGIGGGSSFKFPLYYSNQHNSWVTGKSNKSIQILSEESAIELATLIRNELVELFELVESTSLETVEDYKDFEIATYSERLLPKLWVCKYLHILYPEKFSCFYSDLWLNFMLSKLEIEPAGGVITKNGQISLLSSSLGIPNVYLYKVLYELFPMIDDEEYQYDFSYNEQVYTLNEDTSFEYNVSLPHRNSRINKKYPLNMILYGAPGTGKTYSTINYAMAIIENCDITDLEKSNRKTLMNKYKKMVEDGRIVFTTFHQSYGYEDFIQGLRPDSDAGALIVKPCDGVFKKITEKAMYDIDNDYVIIIDEINRANISKVFGELITLLEEDKRWGELNELSVKLPSKETFAIPNNLYIIGTMNTADKSISLIDIALRRRFEFIEQTVNYGAIKNDVCKDFLKVLNKKIIEELESTDLLIGHAYFINKSEDDLLKVINQNIIPLLYEYFFDNTKKVRHVLDKALECTKLKLIDNEFSRIKVDKK